MTCDSRPVPCFRYSRGACSYSRGKSDCSFMAATFLSALDDFHHFKRLTCPWDQLHVPIFKYSERHLLALVGECRIGIKPFRKMCRGSKLSKDSTSKAEGQKEIFINASRPAERPNSHQIKGTRAPWCFHPSGWNYDKGCKLSHREKNSLKNLRRCQR